MSTALNPLETAVLASVQAGMPIAPKPYAMLANDLGVDENTVITTLDALETRGILKRFGLVVKHRELGFSANAMTVFDVPPDRVDAAGAAVSQLDFVTLCYQRRRTERWPFNLYCMIHGRDRAMVRAQVDQARRHGEIEDVDYRVLFSRRRFKQCGGRYVAPSEPAASDGLDALDALDRRIINRLQDGMPLTHRPYDAVAGELGCDTGTLLDRLQRLLDQAWLTRFGPMYAADRLGGGLTLAAMAVPPERFDAVAETLSAMPQVAHNYEREHALNMWFVLATETDADLDAAVARIERETGLNVLLFPKQQEYFVGFRVAV